METLNKIASCRAQVAIVDPRSGVTQPLKIALKALGFTGVVPFESVRDFLRASKQETFDWVLTTVLENEAQTGLQMLEALYMGLSNSKTRISLFVTREQSQCLPVAFELGLLSWHEAQFSSRFLIKDLKVLLEVIAREHWNDAYVAAHYLRVYLTRYKLWEELTHLEKKLTQTFAQDESLILNLAEAHYLSGEPRVGQELLNKLQTTSTDLLNRARLIHERYSAAPYQIQDTFAAKHHMSQAVVIDSDPQAANAIAETLRQIGVPQIHIFHDGDSAWQHIESNAQPQVIIHEWRIPGMTGPVFIQRLRQKGLDIPLVVCSSLIQKSDAPLLHDMSVSQIVEKPVRPKQLIMAIGWAIMQYEQPTESKSLERRIIQCLSLGEFATARNLRTQFLAHSDTTQARRHYIEGAFAYYENNVLLAIEHLKKSLDKSNRENIDIMSLLGRALLKIGDYRSAMAFMEKVSHISPQNIERICALADVQMETGQIDKAKYNLERAQSMDETNELVQHMQAKHALLCDDKDRARDLIQNSQSSEEMLSFLNNIAVAKSKVGELDQSIALYRKLLQVLPAEHLEYLAVAHYNMSLAFVRHNDLVSAHRHLEQAIQIGFSRVTEKAASLLQRIEQAQKQGTKLELRIAKTELIDRDTEIAMVHALSRIEQGGNAGSFNGIGLRGIYQPLVVSSYGKSLMRKAS